MKAINILTCLKSADGKVVIESRQINLYNNIMKNIRRVIRKHGYGMLKDFKDVIKFTDYIIEQLSDLQGNLIEEIENIALEARAIVLDNVFDKHFFRNVKDKRYRELGFVLNEIRDGVDDVEGGCADLMSFSLSYERIKIEIRIWSVLYSTLSMLITDRLSTEYKEI